MINLAGNPDPDPIVERELIRCRIEVVRGERSQGEVAASLTGRLGPFVFRRAWRYWVVDGRMPIAVADELYADPVGREDVRVDGHCGCQDPRDGDAEWYDADGMKLVPKTEEAEYRRLAEHSESFRELIKTTRFVDDPTQGNGFIETYHIDSEIGLRLFADTVRRHWCDIHSLQPGEDLP